MMYLHFCSNCSRIYILNGHKLNCPKCSFPVNELQMSYLEYVVLPSEQRSLVLEQCKNENSLKKISTTYRMYKYSKWYKNANPSSVPVPDINRNDSAEGRTVT